MANKLHAAYFCCITAAAVGSGVLGGSTGLAAICSYAVSPDGATSAHLREGQHTAHNSTGLFQTYHILWD
jgi:hypothetical protein